MSFLSRALYAHVFPVRILCRLDKRISNGDQHSLCMRHANVSLATKLIDSIARALAIPARRLSLTHPPVSVAFALFSGMPRECDRFLTLPSLLCYVALALPVEAGTDAREVERCQQPRQVKKSVPPPAATVSVTAANG